jgi:hypothetical protein
MHPSAGSLLSFSTRRILRDRAGLLLWGGTIPSTVLHRIPAAQWFARSVFRFRLPGIEGRADPISQNCSCIESLEERLATEGDLGAEVEMERFSLLLEFEGYI